MRVVRRRREEMKKKRASKKILYHFADPGNKSHFHHVSCFMFDQIILIYIGVTPNMYLVLTLP